MAQLTSTSADKARSLVTGALTATGSSASFVSDDINRSGGFNAALWGVFVGTMQLERSFDGGTTWLPCSLDTSGTVASYTAPVSLTCNEPERNVLYRWRCTAFTSGTINYRLSK